MPPQRYRKKPVEIEAMHFTDVSAGSRIAEWCGGTNVDSPHEIRIDTLEGIMTATLGDWIIKGVRGEFYPCDAGVFAETYDPADVVHPVVREALANVFVSVLGSILGLVGVKPDPSGLAAIWAAVWPDIELVAASWAVMADASQPATSTRES